jgi:hypothetical protein
MGCDCADFISPGDITDKLTILCIKLSKIPGNQLIKDEWLRTIKLVGHLLYRLDLDQQDIFWEYTQALLYINLDQWRLEDKVRSEKSWEAAVGARENNKLRVEMKNKIAELFSYPNEVKLYQW